MKTRWMGALVRALRARGVDVVTAREIGMIEKQYSVGEQARRLLRLISENSTESMRNRVEFLSA